MTQGRIEEAEEQLNQALEVVSGDPVLLNNAGVCALFLGNYEQALDRFRAAAAVVPHESRYLANQALALGLMGQYDASRQIYLQVLSPREAEHNMGVILAMRQAKGLESLKPLMLPAPSSVVVEEIGIVEMPEASALIDETAWVAEEEEPAVIVLEEVSLAPVESEVAEVPAKAGPSIVTVAPQEPVAMPVAVAESEEPQEKAAEAPQPVEVSATAPQVETEAAQAIAPTVEMEPLPGIRALREQSAASEASDLSVQAPEPVTPAADVAADTTPSEEPAPKREPGSVMSFKKTDAVESAPVSSNGPISAISEPPAMALEDVLPAVEIETADEEVYAPTTPDVQGGVEVVDALTVE
jgi:hypothetical protein